VPRSPLLLDNFLSKTAHADHEWETRSTNGDLGIVDEILDVWSATRQLALYPSLVLAPAAPGVRYYPVFYLEQ
jgi:hypothetical protein